MLKKWQSQNDVGMSYGSYTLSVNWSRDGLVKRRNPSGLEIFLVGVAGGLESFLEETDCLWTHLKVLPHLTRSLSNATRVCLAEHVYGQKVINGKECVKQHNWIYAWKGKIFQAIKIKGQEGLRNYRKVTWWMASLMWSFSSSVQLNGKRRSMQKNINHDLPRRQS